MNPADSDRIDRLYQMALNTHTGTGALSLRCAARDGIRAEMEKQPGVVDWLRSRGLLACEPFTVAYGPEMWWMVLVRDDTLTPGGTRGSSGPTVEEAAASCVCDQLAAMVAGAFGNR